MNHLRYILEEDPEKGRLDRAALELATIQFPDLDPEPYLLQLGFIARTPRGRVATFAAYRHLGLTPPGRQGGNDLFSHPDSDG